MFKRRWTVLLVAGLLAVWSTPSHADEPDDEARRIERLAALGRLWGVLDLAHPHLVERDIDWDQALIETIPLVDAADTDEDYAAAVEHLLGLLEDPQARVTWKPSEDAAEEPAPVDPEAPVDVEDALPIRTTVLEDGVVVLDLTDYRAIVDGAGWGSPGVLQEALEGADEAPAVVVDLRFGKADGLPDEDWYAIFMMDHLLGIALGALPVGALIQPATRTRIHDGYPPRDGGSSGGYVRGFLVSSHEVIAGIDGSFPPLVVLTDSGSGMLMPKISGLRNSGAAQLVYQGDPACLTGETAEVPLTAQLTADFLATEYIDLDGAIGLAVDAIVDVQGEGDPDQGLEVALALARGERAPTAVERRPASAPIARAEATYPDLDPMPREHRLLALFRLWTVIDRFFPYHHLADEPWETLLPEFVPVFEAADDLESYHLAVAELAARIDDSHIVAYSEALAGHLGTAAPEIEVARVEDRWVVVRAGDAARTRRIEPGDLILSIDGHSPEERLEELRRFVPASTTQAFEARALRYLFAGPAGSKVRITVGSDAGDERTVKLERVEDGMPRRYVTPILEQELPVVATLPEGYGYVDLDRLELPEVDAMFTQLGDAPAILFDMRGYPAGTAWAVAPRLTERDQPTGARFSRAIWTGSGLGGASELTHPTFSFEQRLPARQGDVYLGPVVVLIDENAISQAEHTCLFLEAAASDITFIGRPTNGANGDVTTVVLPGDLSVRFTGHDVRHADGRQLQRLGIQPDLRVDPTIEGIREGRDEILEAAIEYLNEKMAPEH